MINLDLVKKNMHNEGVIINKRASIMIPKESTVFPDYGEGYCVYCGKDLPPLKRKYCCPACGPKYRQETARYWWVWWNDFRDAIQHRDDFKCVECGDIEKLDKELGYWTSLAVHHIIPLHNGGEEFDPDNCITLCTGCHKLKHQKRHLEPTLISKQMTLEGS